jgi:hypothetical protein
MAAGTAVRIARALLVVVAGAVLAGQPTLGPPPPQAGAAIRTDLLWERPIDGELLGVVDPVTATIAVRVRLSSSTAEFAGLDTRTGLPRWQRGYPEFDSADTTVDLAGQGRFLVRGRSGGGTGPTYLWALNAADGRIVWQRPMPVGRPTVLGTAVLVPDNQDLLAVSLADGAVQWRWTAPLNCTITWSSAGATMFTTAILCSGYGYLLTVDAVSRTTLWSREWFADAKGYEVAGDVVLGYGDDWFTVYDRAGAVVFDTGEPLVCSVPCLTVVDGTLVLSTVDRDRLALRGIDLATHRAMWNRTVPYANLTVSEGLILLTGAAPDPMPGTVISTLDARSGRLRSTTVLATIWVTAQDSRTRTLYLSRTDDAAGRLSTRAAAVRLVDTAPAGMLGGADPADWPDPCALLNTADLGAVVPGRTYRPVAQPRVVAGTDTGTTAVCRFLPDPADGPVITVSIAWCGVDAAQAGQALAALSAQRYLGAVPGLGDEAVRVRLEGQLDAGLRSTLIAFRTGRVVTTVATLGDAGPDTTLAVARAVARRLPAPHPSSGTGG